MNRRQQKVYNIILNKIKPDDCQVCFFKDGRGFTALADFHQRSFYDEYNKIIFIYNNNSKNRSINRFLWAFLHEICHHLTWHSKWDRDKYKIKCVNNTYQYILPSTYYLSEYVAEKLLRKICNKYKLTEILNESNKWIKVWVNDDRYVHISPVNKYRYAADRIVREEKLFCGVKND